MSTTKTVSKRAPMSAEMKAERAAAKAAAKAIKTVSFAILQDGFSFKYELSGRAADYSGTTPEIVRNIAGKLYSLMLLRKSSGQKLGLNFSKEFAFEFTTNERVINTLRAQTSIGLKIKLGYKAERRRRFELILGLLIDEIMRGNALYSAAEIAVLDTRLDLLQLSAAQN